MRKPCVNCGRSFDALTERAAYCSGRCRAEASRTRRGQVVTEALDAAERALEKARGALKGGERKR